MVNKFNFSDKDYFHKLERQAYDGTIDVSKFPPAEYRYFSELRKVYYDFKFEGLPKEEAAQRKAVLLGQYREAVSEHERCLEVYGCHQDNIRKAGITFLYICGI